MKTNFRFLVIFSFALLTVFGQAKAAAPGRAVRIVIILPGRIDVPGKRFVTGDTVPANFLNTILFTKERCSLPIEGARDMLRAWMALGSYQVGCWYPTVDDTYVTIDGLGNLNNSRSYWEFWPRALLHPDGSATITEPNYDSDTFMARVANEKMHQRFSHQAEKP